MIRRWGWLGAALPLCAGQALAVDKGEFRGPGMEGFVKIQEYDADGDGDGDKETLVRRFRNLNGDLMFTMTTKDQLWAWSVDAVGDDDSRIERNYVLRDSDCDGRFDERYRLDEQFTPPDCLK
jgi:hypothetical protein